MKKLLTVLLTFAALQASALNHADSNLNLRVEAGATSAMSDSELFSYGATVGVGASYHAAFSRRVYLEPGLLFEYSEIKADGIGGKGDRYGFDAKAKTLSFVVPVSFGVNIVNTGSLRVSVYTGPRVYINLSGKISGTEAHIKGETKPVEVDPVLSSNGIDFVWAGGAAVQWRRFRLSVEAGAGLTQTMKLNLGNEQYSLKRQPILVGLSYSF